MGMAFHKIIQDHYGFIWCTSSNGLYRYDGYQFKAFKKYVTHSSPIRSDFIWDILEDGQYNIWLATYDGGVNKWERKTGQFFYYRHEPGNPNSLASDNVLRMMMDREGSLWLIVERKDGVPVLDRLDPVSGRVQHYRYQPENALSLNSDSISIISLSGSPLQPMIQDQEGQIWVATRGGLNLYVPSGNGFRTIPGPWPGRDEHIIHLYESPAVPGLIWILTASKNLASGHVYQLESKSQSIDSVPLPIGGGLTNAPTGIYQPAGQPDELWLSSRELCHINLKDGSTKRYVPELSSNASLWQGLRDSLFFLHPGPTGQPWMLPMSFPPVGHTRGSEKFYFRNGFYQLDASTDKLRLISDNPTTQPAPAFGMVLSAGSSQNGDTWIGCFPGFYQLRQEKPGQHFQPSFKNIELWEPSLDPTNLSAWAAIERPAGILWVATFKGGLQRINLQSGELVSFRHQPGDPKSIADNNIFALYADEQEGRLWIGTEAGLDWITLDELDQDTPHPVFHHLHSDERLGRHSITSITRGPDGLIWIGTTQAGLLLFDPDNERVVEQYNAKAGQVGALNRSYINTVFTDSRGRSWVATGMGGLCQALATEEGQESFAFQCHLDGMYIVDIFENADGKLWLAAMNYGIAIFDPETGDHELWNMENHLARNSVLGIEQDKKGMIWFTSLGLTRFDPQSNVFRPFRLSAGIKDEDPGRLLLTLKDGRMVYSSLNGWLQVFDPNEVMSNPRIPQVVITGLSYYDQARKTNRTLSLTKNIEVASEITLKYSQQPFSIEYVGLEFNDPEGIRFATRLEGYEMQWNDAGGQRSARYLQVPPGQYTFLVKAINSDGLEMKTPLALQVTILPPWWRTNAAFIAYAFIIGLTLYYIIAYQRRRWRLQTQLKLKQLEAAQLKELDAVKTRLFTDIAHEFRTPLAVIEGAAGQIKEKPQQWVDKGVDMIQRNTRQLLRLANQLLDLSKVQSGLMGLFMVQGEVIAFLQAALEPFATLAAHEGIRLQTDLYPEKLEMDYDPDKLQQILSNLLSNALKFTPKGGLITVRSQEVRADGQLHLQITVEDTGPGISADELPYIFKRWFRGNGSQSASGAGIGLALTKELVQMLGGAITAGSPEGAGATFRILLPVHNKAPREGLAPPTEKDGTEQADTEAALAQGNRLKLLIVEDNSDIIEYLASFLDGDYELLVAGNGKDGLKKATSEVPDVIISDIMMPEMDGLELCRRLKAGFETSHIPILLLTALADKDSRIEGYETGADAYLPKPFDKRELLARLRQLTENRKRLQEYYRAGLHSLLPPGKKKGAPDKEEIFLAQARQAILDNISDSDFGTEELYRKLGMSRTQLHKKLSALTGQSTAIFIRSIRLNFAKQLLEQTPGLQVAQAAYESGFKDPNYFSRCFTEEFGVNPKDVRP